MQAGSLIRVIVALAAAIGALQPAISIRAGDYDPAVDAGDPSYVVPDTSASADSGGVMREAASSTSTTSASRPTEARDSCTPS